MNKHLIWKIYEENGPLVTTAIHDGHLLRKEVAQIIGLSDVERLREEDPFTSYWTTIGDTKIIGLQSRFEVDLNRPREKAVYINPEDAWGLHVWKTKPSPEIITASLAEYDAFYSEVKRIFSGLKQKFHQFVIFDLHTYNHRREGPNGPPADPKLNPEVNLGTGTMDRKRWAPLVDRFINEMRAYDFRGRSLDVRENIKFKGGQFSRWIHETFPESACSLAIEFKKFFMDEWSGEPEQDMLDDIRKALRSTIPGVREEVGKLSAK
ncbi:MAG: N-formylglutamate amidohydrolase [Ignavibacteriaceae bacterium]